MGNSAIAVFKPLYERILSATLQLQRGQGSSAELSSAFQADQVHNPPRLSNQTGLTLGTLSG
jgi:hypothetical protein